ncbi:DUF4926 domain-containing protein [Paenibacillus sp. GCM10023252]|uniref:DUF4926 domain-containing protein n=1 Tax=Paenibacillus sp. GCM10023252 TaxID=3252649 RepID=UPI003608A654
MKQFDKVKLVSESFNNYGVNIGSIGYILDIFPDGNLDVEFSDSESGETIAIIILSPVHVEIL